MTKPKKVIRALIVGRESEKTNRSTQPNLSEFIEKRKIPHRCPICLGNGLVNCRIGE